MKVAIDVSQVAYGTGVSVYVRELVGALIKSGKLKVHLFAGSLRMRGQINDAFPGITIQHLPFPPKIADIVWNKVHLLPIDYFLEEFDLLHTSDWTEPKSNKPKVTTIHDISPLTHPQYTPQVIVDLTKRRIELIKQESRSIIVPTKHVKSECIEFGINEDRLHVVPEAVSETFLQKSKNLKRDVSGDYILAVGTHPRKNLPTTITAFKKIKGKHGIKRLIVVGNGKSEDGIEFTGKVSEERLVELYNSALCLCYPSIDEGFGLPILEAMSLGVPVVTTNYGATKETAGGAAFTIDNVLSPNEIASGVKEVIVNSSKFVTKGYKNASTYSWSSSAKMTLDIYKETITGK